MRSAGNQKLFYSLFVVLVFTACQKGYAPDGVTVSTATGTVVSGSTTLLAKDETKTTGSTEATTNLYEYDASSRLTRITTIDIDSSNKSITTVFRYVRDASGKITSVITNSLAANSPAAGYPDSIYVNVNYPSGSSTYNFTSYGFSVATTSVKDSIGYVYAGGNITDAYEYQAISTTSPSLTLVSRIQYVYSNGNIVAQKVYTPNAGALTLAGTYSYDYDSKISPLVTGNEGFLVGQNIGFVSKNNPVKVVITDNVKNTTLYTFDYTLQYSAANLPLSGTILQTPGNKTSTIKFTYK